MRDPRTDPQPGDVLRANGTTRAVEKVWAFNSTVRVAYRSEPANGFMSLRQWWVWAADAEVVNG